VIEDAADRQSRGTAGEKTLDLDELDPLPRESEWDDAYQHLLDQTEDLLDLGDLMRSEADDLLERSWHENAAEQYEDQQLENDGVPSDSPQVLKFSRERPESRL
jgi:hypothetical protein